MEAQVCHSITALWVTCKALGLLINKKKLALVPVQRIEFIGAVLNSTQVRAFLPEGRCQALSDLINQVTAHPLTTARVCLKLLGHMAACTYVVQHARLHLRPLQMWFSLVYSPARHSLDIVLSILPLVLTHCLGGQSLYMWQRGSP